MTLVATRYRFLALLVSLVLPLVGAGLARGQNIIAQWNFDTVDQSGYGSGNGTVRTGLGYEAQIVDPSATALDISLSDSLPDTTESWIELFPGGLTDPVYGTPVLRVPPGSQSRNPYEAIANNRYFEFTVFANGGLLHLESLTFDAARGGAATPRGWILLSLNAAGVASFVDTQDAFTQRPSFYNYAVDLSGSSYQNLSQITFRIYTYTPSSGQSLEYDNITIYGTVQ
jgi:hypothetical protein